MIIFWLGAMDRKWEVLFSHKRDDHLTPPQLFNIINKHYGQFDLDPACDEQNHLKIKVCYTEKIDGLKQRWFGKVFVNPPYSKTKEFLMKGIEELDRRNCDLIVYLVPARTDTRWFHTALESKYLHEIIFIKSRVRFLGTKTSAPFPSVLLIFRNKPRVRVRIGVLDQKHGVIKYLT